MRNKAISLRCLFWFNDDISLVISLYKSQIFKDNNKIIKYTINDYPYSIFSTCIINIINKIGL